MNDKEPLVTQELRSLWQSLKENPDDVSCVAVLADALLHNGHPLGESLALCVRRLDELRAFTYCPFSLSRLALQTIAQTSWASLDLLELAFIFRPIVLDDGCAVFPEDPSLASHDFGPNVHDFSRLFINESLRVRRLSCRCLSHSDDVLRMLADSPCLAHLRSLEFTDGSLSAEGAKRIEKFASQFQHIEHVCILANPPFDTVTFVAG